MEQGRFRQDLYFRLAVLELEVPPLHERIEDIPLLAEWLLHEMNPDLQVLLTPLAVQKLQGYLWPGNVRELRNVLARSVALLGMFEENNDIQYLDAEDVELPNLTSPESNSSPAPSPVSLQEASLKSPSTVSDLKTFLEDTERIVLHQALEKHSWNISRTAKSLSITRAWLYKRIAKYGLAES